MKLLIISMITLFSIQLYSQVDNNSKISGEAAKEYKRRYKELKKNGIFPPIQNYDLSRPGALFITKKFGNCAKKFKKAIKRGNEKDYRKCLKQQFPVPFELKSYIEKSPVDDPDAYDVDTSVEYKATLSSPYWVSPSGHLPLSVKPLPSNNIVNLYIYKQRLFVAFRTGPSHYASAEGVLYVVSSSDGIAWEHEATITSKNSDSRQPLFYEAQGKLHMMHYMPGAKAKERIKEHVQRYTRDDSNASWGNKIEILGKGEYIWELKRRKGKLWLSTFTGEHYEITGPPNKKVHIKHSDDGINFTHASGIPHAYHGGASETAFEFDEKGDFWAVTRNESGDATGFGHHVIYAPDGNEGRWDVPQVSDPHIYMSPKMFRHGDDVYLVGRRQTGRLPFGHANPNRSWRIQRLTNWLAFTWSPKTTSLFKLNKETRVMEPVMDLPGAGDTALPSIIRLDKDNFLIGNYTSPPGKKERWWMQGQLGKTFVYLIKLTFAPITKI